MKRDEVLLHKEQEASVSQLHRPGYLVANSWAKRLNVAMDLVAERLK